MGQSQQLQNATVQLISELISQSGAKNLRLLCVNPFRIFFAGKKAAMKAIFAKDPDRLARQSRQ
jgi:hypothetical protein